MKDALGERMKSQYEHRTRYSLPRRTYTIIRLDGKAFHTFTENCNRPFDKHVTELMNDTALALCKNIQGAKFAFVQSDEISILLTDFEKPTTDAWYDGNIQKITSVSASIATYYFNANLTGLLELEFENVFNKFVNEKEGGLKIGLFDSRVFTIPDRVEVENYFIWRQQDCIRNSVQMVAQSLYSQKELHGKNQAALHEMIHQKDHNWAKYPEGDKNGRLVFLKDDVHYWDFPTKSWMVGPAPVFTQGRDVFKSLIPVPGY